MKTLIVLKKDADDTIRTLIDQASIQGEVDVVNLKENQDFDSLVERIEQCQKVITW